MIPMKFRAWDKKEKKFHYFGFNDFCGYEELEKVETMTDKIASGVYLRDGFYFSTNTNDRKGEICPWIEITQYTGIKDKNEKEIYEGDIVEKLTPDESDPVLNPYKLIVLLVVFENGQVIGKVSKNSYSYNINRASKIIGNIYENKNLLKKHLT